MSELNLKRIEVLPARDECGRRLWVIDAVAEDHDGVSRVILSDHYSKTEAIVAALELKCQGYTVAWPEGGR